MGKGENEMLTIDDLGRILTEVAGRDDGVNLSGGIDETSFEELGYDSLALMEMAARIERDYGVKIGDDELADLRTPGAVLGAVNHGLAQAS
jgi:act minimal PKS acyl carrier protein